MIKANELRIGNWVIENDYSYKQIDYRDDDFWHTDNFSPIPLTPEILEKCGFDMLSLSKDFVNLIYDNRQYWYAEYLPQSKPITYLHQLQNLYFALTGEELTVNLSEKITV